jgi:hypothetical protein
VALLLTTLLFAVSGVSLAQKRAIRRRPSSSAQRPSIDYSRFSHATNKHQQACNTCHKVPTDNWKEVRDFPDVADYPGHAACIGCHRPQFFKGAKPLICSICHSSVSPRDDARYAFRNPAAAHQFLIEFPHDKHQDVIAKQLETPLEATPPAKPVGFIRASFGALLNVTQTVSLRSGKQSNIVRTESSQTNSLRYSAFSDSPSGATAKTYNNCAICHATRANVPAAPVSGWTDRYVPDNVTFKSVPSSHASCFNCHWKSQEPVSDNCAGCHKLTAPYDAADSIKRISMKFRHEGGGPDKNHVMECTACHINITRAATLRGLKPDVPITACSECHNKSPSHLEIANELEAIDKNRDFVCTYCHTSNVGRLDPPASHYLIAERPPRKRSDPK